MPLTNLLAMPDRLCVDSGDARSQHPPAFLCRMSGCTRIARLGAIYVQCRQRPARYSWEEPIKRLIWVLERILGYDGSSGYDPEGMILG